MRRSYHRRRHGYTFLKAQGGKEGLSLVDDEKLEYCENMLDKAEILGKEIYLPEIGRASCRERV